MAVPAQQAWSNGPFFGNSRGNMPCAQDSGTASLKNELPDVEIMDTRQSAASEVITEPRHVHLAADVGYQTVLSTLGSELEAWTALRLWSECVGTSECCGPAEIKSLFRKLSTSQAPDLLFEYMDLDCDGFVSRSEFLTWVLNKPPQDESLFNEVVKARESMSCKLADRISEASELEVSAGFALGRDYSLEESARMHTLPDLALKDPKGRIILRPADSAGSCTMIAWALAPQVSLKNRLRVLDLVAHSGDPWSFAALLTIVHLGSSFPLPAETADILKAQAFEILPRIIDKEHHLQVQAAIDASAGLGLLHQDVHVRASATACLGRVFRFRRVKELDVCLDCETAASSMEDVLRGCLSYMDPRVRRTAAESISVMVSQGGVDVAKLLLPSLIAPHGMIFDGRVELRISAVLALQHLLAGAPSLEDGWVALVKSFADTNTSVRRTVHVSLQQLASADNSHTKKILPLLKRLLGSNHEGEILHEDARACIVDAASTLASSCKLSSDMTLCAAELGLFALESTSVTVKLPALKVLSLIGEFSRAIDAVIAQVSFGDAELCLQACRALASVAPRGHSAAVAAVVQALNLESSSELQAAEIAGILAKLSEIGGDAVATDALLIFLASRPKSHVCKSAALRGIAAAAPIAHSAARAAVLDLFCELEHRDVLMAAAIVANNICQLGDTEVVRVLTNLAIMETSLKDPMLQNELLKTLGNLSQPGDTVVLSTLKSRLDSGSSWPVRRTILQTIAALTPTASSCPEAINALQSSLADLNPDVRQTAVETLVSIARPGDQRAIKLLEEMQLEPQGFQVEMSIEEGLEMLAGDAFEADGDLASSSLNITCFNDAGSFQAVDAVSVAMISDTDLGSTMSFEVVDANSSRHLHQSCSSDVEGSVSSFQIVDTGMAGASV